MKTQDTINLVTSGLGLAIDAYEAAKRLSAEGYHVPGLDEFERRTIELRELPDLITSERGGNDGGTSPLPAEAHA